MEELGYVNYYQILNAKDYGIPQNRERIFTISIRNDIKTNFVFPKKQELKIKLKDMLENNVDEKYYLSQTAIKGRLATHYQKYKLEENIVNNKDIHPTILARFEGAPTLLVDDIIGTYQYAKSDKFMNGKDRFNFKKEISDTIQTSQKEGVVYKNLRVRKLIPLETWRLMGFDDEDFYKAEKVNSNSQLYKQAGNSIVVNVLEEILKELLKEK
jgi:DNA (cytosine-5)-methyltransferase 1